MSGAGPMTGNNAANDSAAVVQTTSLSCDKIKAARPERVEGPGAFDPETAPTNPVSLEMAPPGSVSPKDFEDGSCERCCNMPGSRSTPKASWPALLV